MMVYLDKMISFQASMHHLKEFCQNFLSVNMVENT